MVRKSEAIQVAVTRGLARLKPEPSMNNSNAGVLSMAALTQYQSDSIVSRTLINRPTGTITLFAFAQGQALSEHTNPYDALLNVLDGEAEVTIGGALSRVKAGEAIILPANIPHAVNAVADFKMMLVMIRS